MNSSEDQQMNVADKKSESFIVDLECFCNGLEMDPTNSGSSTTSNYSTTTNPRITMQRSLSRKGSGAEKKINYRDFNMVPSSSPRGAQVVSLVETTISPPTLAMGTRDHLINNNNNNNNEQVSQQHQITIKTGGVSSIKTNGRSWIKKRSSFKGTPSPWFSDPKRVVLFFASLSSIGTLLLIYFTLSMTNQNDGDGMLD